MSDIFVSNQRWIYATGATLSAALHRLADTLPVSDIPVDHYPVDYDLKGTTTIEVVYCDDPDDDESFYRAGVCVSWKPET